MAEEATAVREAEIVKIKTAGVGMPDRAKPVRYTALYDQLEKAELDKNFELELEASVLLANARFSMLVYAEEKVQDFEVIIGQDHDAHSLVILKSKRGKNGKAKAKK